MYVARSADVTFSDVKLVVDGKEITSAGEPEKMCIRDRWMH